MSSSRTSGRDLWETILSEHRMVEQLHSEINNRWKSNTGNNKSLESNRDLMTLIFMLLRDLSVHSHKELILVYPLFEKLNSGNNNNMMQQGGGGQENKSPNEQYDHAVDEHKEVEGKCAEIEALCMQLQKQQLSTSTTQAIDLPDQLLNMVNQLMESVTHHVKSEEQDLVPLLQSLVQPNSQESIELGRKWEALNGRVATRPLLHLNTPTKGEAFLAANVAQADTDKQIDTARFGHAAPTAPGKPSAAMAGIQLSQPLPQEQVLGSGFTKNDMLPGGPTVNNINDTTMKDENMGV